jgi:hypothetical protein
LNPFTPLNSTGPSQWRYIPTKQDKKGLKMARRKNGAIEVIGAILLLPILAVTSFVSWIQELIRKPMLSDADYQHLAIMLLIIAGIGWGIWTLVNRMLRHRREYREAVTAFRWDEMMSPITFEQHCSDYLKLKGWAANTTKASGDQGCDVIARKGRCTVVIQCKKYSKPVGNTAVQEIHAAKQYYGADIGMVVSNQGYTRGAIDLAQSTNVHLLHFTDLRNIDRFCSKMFPEMGK